MLHYILIFLLVLLSPNIVFAVTKYVRPLGGSYGTQDGTSYANAFNGFSGISGLSAGDTLIICGAHTEAYQTTVNGTAGNRVTLDGSCPSGTNGSITVTIAADGAIVMYAAQNFNDYYTIKNLTLKGGGIATVFCEGNASACDNLILQNNTITCDQNFQRYAVRLVSPSNATITGNTINGSGTCGIGIMLESGQIIPTANAFINNSVTSNTVYGFVNIGIRFKGLNVSNPVPGPHVVQGNEVYNVSSGIYPETFDGLTVSGNNVHDTIQGVGEGYCYASTWSDNSVWQYNTGYNCYSKGIEVYADTTRALTNVKIRGNKFYDVNTSRTGFWCTIDVNNGTPPTAVWTGVVVEGNVIQRGPACGINISAGTVATVANNTLVSVGNEKISGQEEAGIFLETSAASNFIYNNICYNFSIRCIWQSSAGSNTYSNNYFHVPTQSKLATLNATDYTSGTITSLDSNAKIGDPLLSSTYIPLSSSPARRAGILWGADCVDPRGRRCNNTPDIGAYQVTSGDAATSRNTATSRTSSSNRSHISTSRSAR